MEQQWTALNAQKRSLASERTVAVATTATAIVPQDTARVALILSVHAGTVFLSLAQQSADAKGVRLTADQGPLRLSLAEHGAVVHGPISAAAPAGATTMGIWEVVNHNA